MPTRMEDLEYKLSQIIDLIERPVSKNRQKTLPNPIKFDNGIQRKSRQGSCPNIREPFVVANQMALKIETGKRNQGGIDEEEEEEEAYLAPNQLHTSVNQKIRKIQSTNEAGATISMSCGTKVSTDGENAIDFAEKDLEELPSEEIGTDKRGKVEEAEVQNGSGAEGIKEDSEITLEKEKDGDGDDAETYYQAVMA